MDTTELEVRREDLTSTSATALIGALNAELAERYPEEGSNHFRLDQEEVVEGRGAFLVCYGNGHPVACGAIRRLDAKVAEIKRMFVEPRSRGRGIGTRLLTVLEAEARRLIAAKNQAATQPIFNLEMAKVYLKAHDPQFCERT